jgi:hypothetical protein
VAVGLPEQVEVDVLEDLLNYLPSKLVVEVELPLKLYTHINLVTCLGIDML